MEMEQQEEDDGDGGVNGDGDSSSSSGSSSNGTTNSSSNSETESSTDEETATNKGEVGNKLTGTVVVPYVGDTDAQKTPSPPPLPTSTVVSTWHAFLEVADWDRENKRVMKLALPYLIQAFLSGVAKAAVVAIIGKYYGTRSLTAFVVIEMTVGLTTEFFGGEWTRCLF